ncbi:MAG: 50S ribosomal protein L11 methyltransferase [Deltaproteobacteria bacterium]|nr:50S ribosomal protein L11 methyltransferase [Deltaproteobacteria bacterium]
MGRDNTAIWSEMHARHYAELANQQNMLEDAIRTAAYHDAILDNRADFEGKVVMDVGAGSGILSLFAAQAGAARVYAVEATPVAECVRTLAKANGFADRITVLQGTVQHLTLDSKVDVIVSEPLGVFLVHERMLDAYVIARERFLKPGGRMFPSAATLFLAPFSDGVAHSGWEGWAHFWEQTSFYGCDLSAMARAARADAFAMPVVGPMTAPSLMAAPVSHAVDFCRVSTAELARMRIPLAFEIETGGTLHGLAGWFDASLSGSVADVTLTTSPHAPKTHWYQTRLLFDRPAVVAPGERLEGQILLTGNDACSYDIRVTLSIPGSDWKIDAAYELHRHRYWWNT